ncbi:hypothetical protein ACFYVL_02095 [Streptomyces sp. NPDC004111]|uniref:hypothetical protein n=1 Tax=Streptomyces sp. NPDC004111 TaxID=3364690 RepID=UPI0036B778FD
MTEHPPTGPAEWPPCRDRTLFAPDEALHLSELSLRAEDYRAFSAGHRIALLHGAGATHGDLFAKHLLFQPTTGRTDVVDFGAAGRAGIDPDRMFPDFATVHLAMGASWARGFLAGYVRSSLLLIDPQCPGYTAAFLANAGGEVRSVAEAAWPVFTEAQCTALLAPVLGLDRGFPRLTGDLPHGAMSPDDLAIVRCALLAAGVGDPARLLPDVAPPGVVGLLTALLAENRSSAVGPDLLVPRLGAWGGLGERLDHPEVPRLLAGMADICDWLALRLDRPAAPSESALINSVRAARLSLMLLQHSSWPVDQLESQELKITSRHRRLSWYPHMLAADPGDGRYAQTVTYSMSRTGLYRRMFAVNSTGGRTASSRLWSASWRALTLSRTALRNALAALRSDTAEEDRVDAPLMVWLLATQYQQAASDNLRASLAVHGLTYVSKNHLRLAHEVMVAEETGKLLRAGRADLLRTAENLRVAPDRGDDFDRMLVRCPAPEY